MKRFFAVLFILPLVVGMACNMPGATPSPVPENLFTQVPLTLTAAALTPAAATATTAPTATQIGAPTATVAAQVCNQASFVSDVTYPDNTQINVNTPFTKTWRLRNAGSCTWTSGYQVVFDSGDQMGGPASQQLTNGTVAPGATVDISIDMQSPAAAGTYRGNWELREPGGATFALSTGPFWVQIQATSQQAQPLPDWPLVRQGDTGPEVYAVQHLLKAHNINVDADGIFGPLTKPAVQHFQSQNGLSADGIVGPQTWPKLIIQAQQGASGQHVRAIQRLLRDKFGYTLDVDGIFGPQTNTAVRDYQDDHGLAVDGIVGPQTWRSMVGE